MIGVLGGTGPQGRGIALRLAAAGHRVVLGSRSAAAGAEAAEAIAQTVAGMAGAEMPTGGANLEAAAAAEVVFVSVPYGGHEPLLRQLHGPLQGKTVVDVVVPLIGPDITVASPPPAGSAAAEAQAILGPATPVVAAFQNVSAVKLGTLGRDVQCDVLICGDDPEAKAKVAALAGDMGLEALDAGPLANAAVVDGLTAVLLGINRRLGASAAGIRITNVPRSGAGG